jgi:hypothetical protein
MKIEGYEKQIQLRQINFRKVKNKMTERSDFYSASGGSIFILQSSIILGGG